MTTQYESHSFLGFAVLVVDIQNDFCHDNGVFAQQRLNVKPAQEVTPKIKAFIDEIREYNVPVIYIRQIEPEEVSPENLKRQMATGKNAMRWESLMRASPVFQLRSL